MFVSFVFLSNLTVADCIINENVMLLFIKNEHFTLLNSVCFWGASSPRPPDQGLCPWTPLGATPPDPHIASRSRARHKKYTDYIADPPNPPTSLSQPPHLCLPTPPLRLKYPISTLPPQICQFQHCT